MTTVFFTLQSARLVASRAHRRLIGEPGGIRGALTVPSVAVVLSGVTRDGAGAPLPACTVDVFLWPDKILYGSVTSDGVGAYRIIVGPGQTFRSVSYNANDTLTGCSAGNLAGV